jgi:RNA polymerase primary sigma factor
MAHRSPTRRLLTAAQEVELSRRIERGDVAAKEQMVEANLRLVYAIAASYRGQGVAVEDLVQEGTVGLVRAVEKFDHRRGLKFSTYAVWWIRRGVINAVREARPIRIPARARRQLAEIRSAESELRRSGAGKATVHAIAERTGLSADRVRVLQGAAQVTASLDDGVGEDGTPLHEFVSDPDAVDPWQHVDGEATRRQLSSMLKLLPQRHREVLVRRYGIDGQGGAPHAEIGASLGVGEERSRQLEREALHRLRELGGGRRAA